MAINVPAQICDACGLEIHGNVVTHPNYDGVYHHQCKFPKRVGDLLIGYDNVVLEVLEPEQEPDYPQVFLEHPEECDCAWCSPLPWQPTNVEY